ncbi:hypothetical protein PF010_g4721 [Phytophthora fragariae]|uniref:Uncharacterized protein n=1 Tax=Phytophthora fragariae TaxID=53985 RepID=A0A6A3T850_9STRA|nr:hypothetical protein PF009_g5515 [Phytophthora fragariae]KAE9127927.1 hypothetical protein PF010_g4721 [Phytophthora fragariae]KAE9131717.1 hypothetical protein PF007_g3994 [Phytophthora fragariae]
MPRATKNSGKTSGKNTNVRPQATSKSKPSQASSEGTRQSKRKRDQNEDQVDGDTTKNKTREVTRSTADKVAKGVGGVTTRQPSVTDKPTEDIEDEMTGPTRGENNVISADEQELSLADLAEAVPALKKMHARLKGGKRQLGKRRSGDKFQLSPSLLVVFAQRYRAARNAHKGVDYQRLSTTKNFKDFKGHAGELRAKEPELKVLLKKALAEQREIDADKPMKNIEALEEEVARLDVQHEEDVAKRKQLEVDIEQREEQHSVMISKLKESYEVEIGKLQSELNEVKAKYDALKGVMTGCGKSAELGGEVNEVKDKVAELEQKMRAETTRQTELVALGNRLARKERVLVAQSEGLKAELERIKGEWAKLEREQSRHDFQVLRYADWERAIDTAKYDREVAIEDAIDLRNKWARENERANDLKMKLASYDACCDTEHSGNASVIVRNFGM